MSGGVRARQWGHLASGSPAMAAGVFPQRDNSCPDQADHAGAAAGSPGCSRFTGQDRCSPPGSSAPQTIAPQAPAPQPIASEKPYARCACSFPSNSRTGPAGGRQRRSVLAANCTASATTPGNYHCATGKYRPEIQPPTRSRTHSCRRQCRCLFLPTRPRVRPCRLL